jgi:hypothetical protein
LIVYLRGEAGADKKRGKQHDRKSAAATGRNKALSGAGKNIGKRPDQKSSTVFAPETQRALRRIMSRKKELELEEEFEKNEKYLKKLENMRGLGQKGDNQKIALRKRNKDLTERIRILKKVIRGLRAMPQPKLA